MLFQLFANPKNNLTLFAVGLILITLLWLDVHMPCTFRNYLGLPCPLCGMTRSTLFTFQGKIYPAILLNAFGLLIPIGILSSIVSLIFWKSHSKQVQAFWRQCDHLRLGWLLIVLLLAYWAYRILFGFPVDI